MTTHIETSRSALITKDNFLSSKESEDLIHHIENDLVLELNPQGKIYGKVITFHRSIGFFSDEASGYKYTGQISRAQPMSEPLKKLLEQVNDDLGTKFNSWLINKYECGDDYIGPHSDDEKELSCNMVACISLGSSRIFRCIAKDKSLKKDIQTSNGQLLLMCGDFQKEFTHQIPKTKTLVGTRISLTARQFK